MFDLEPNAVLCTPSGAQRHIWFKFVRDVESGGRGCGGERSVLEGGRSITLAEKGGAGAEEVVAAPAFRIVATMNPGGDYGKRELSPALSNRFTSIWVPAIDDVSELRAILRARFTGLLSPAALIDKAFARAVLQVHFSRPS